MLYSLLISLTFANQETKKFNVNLANVSNGTGGDVGEVGGGTSVNFICEAEL